MLKKIFIASLLVSAPAIANVSPEELRTRLEIRAETYIFDESGQHVLSGPERTSISRFDPDKGTLEGDWSSSMDAGFIGLRQRWWVTEDGVIKAKIGEYSSQDKDRALKGLIEEKEFTLSNLEPISWKVKNIKNHNFVVRMVASLRAVRTPIAVDSLPVAGSKISVTDNAGYLWASDAEFNGKYTGLTTHRGSLLLSYVPFAGSKEMGVAEGSQIILAVDKSFKIFLNSTTSFLPAGVVAKVYAMYVPDKKSKGFNSVHTWDSNKEDRFLERLKR